MTLTDPRHVERRPVKWLAPLMVVSNAFLFLCMAVLGVLALNGGESLGILPLGGDANQQIVRDFLAQRMPSETYRIRAWLPATPLDESPPAVAANRSQPAAAGGVAQPVKLVFYGPKGANRWTRSTGFRTEK